jgi:glyceraldehyde 3-phosphate dehydrogenase
MGRALLRISLERSELSLVAINELASTEQVAALLAHDTLHGRLPHDVSTDGDNLIIAGHRIRVFHQPQAQDIPWAETPASLVADATGKCLTRDCAVQHLTGSVRKVLVSANASGLDLTICLGVNDSAYEASKHHLLSAASCTTNCLAPVAYLLHREYGLVNGALNTVHSYNNDQRLLEAPHRDLRRARAAALNMVPTTTSAVDAIGRVIPALAGRIRGLAVRVPTPNVSLIDLVVALERPASIDALKTLFRTAAEDELAGILAVSEEELVSSDFLGDPHSAIVDLPLTQEVGGGLYRIVAWYDNEWGHASRLADLIVKIGRELR